MSLAFSHGCSSGLRFLVNQWVICVGRSSVTVDWFVGSVEKLEMDLFCGNTCFFSFIHALMVSTKKVTEFSASLRPRGGGIGSRASRLATHQDGPSQVSRPLTSKLTRRVVGGQFLPSFKRYSDQQAEADSWVWCRISSGSLPWHFQS